MSFSNLVERLILKKTSLLLSVTLMFRCSEPPASLRSAFGEPFSWLSDILSVTCAVFVGGSFDGGIGARGLVQFAGLRLFCREDAREKEFGEISLGDFDAAPDVVSGLARGGTLDQLPAWIASGVNSTLCGVSRAIGSAKETNRGGKRKSPYLRCVGSSSRMCCCLSVCGFLNLSYRSNDRDDGRLDVMEKSWVGDGCARRRGVVRQSLTTGTNTL